MECVGLPCGVECHGYRGNADLGVAPIETSTGTIPPAGGPHGRSVKWVDTLAVGLGQWMNRREA